MHFLLTGTLVVNLGDCLQAWTKGLYRATRHRVRRSIKTDRYSVPLFFNPNRGCIIEPIETDVTRNLTFTKIVKGLEMPFRYGDFARTLLEKSHGWSRRQNKIDWSLPIYNSLLRSLIVSNNLFPRVTEFIFHQATTLILLITQGQIHTFLGKKLVQWWTVVKGKRSSSATHLKMK